ncbi:MAG: acyltransferase family protein, partial [Flavobacteriales bacterium]
NDSSRETLQILNSLRAVAAMMVCLYHSAFLMAPYFPRIEYILNFGQEGVYVFFVISGMVMPLSMDKIGYRISNFFTFMGKRIVRLQPPLIVSACIVAITSWAMLNTEDYNGWQLLATSATLTAPFFDLPWVNGIYWTLFVEMQYYIYIALAFPLLIRSSITMRSILVAALLAISFTSLGMEGNDAKSNLPFHLPVFLMGFYLFLKARGRIKEVEFWLGIAACTVVCGLLTGILHDLGFRIVSTAFLTSLVIRFASSGWSWLNRVGEASYSIYLMHWPIISTMCFLLGGILKTAWGNTVVFCSIQLTAVLFAFFFYRLVEKPALSWSKKLTYRKAG